MRLAHLETLWESMFKVVRGTKGDLEEGRVLERCFVEVRMTGSCVYLVRQ